MAAHCFQCKRDADEDKPCMILGRSMAYEIDDPEYPTEWITREDGTPTCTAFLHEDDPEPEQPYRCEHTLDLFTPPTQEGDLHDKAQ